MAKWVIGSAKTGMGLQQEWKLWDGIGSENRRTETGM